MKSAEPSDGAFQFSAAALAICLLLASGSPVAAAEGRPAAAKTDSASAARPEAASAAPNTLTPAQIAEGWILLFDGASLYGWHAATKADWKVHDGAIEVSAGEPGLLNTTTQFGDFELQADFRAPPATNSGIFLRTSPLPKDPLRDCYELNIHSAAGARFPTGSLVARQRGASNGVDDTWHHYHVVAQGGKFTVRLDDRQVLEYVDPHPLARGHIGLQLNQGPVAFRNIKLRPLGLAPIFNGRDLTGWTVFPGKASRFEVNSAGELQVTGGPGQLETNKQYGDFILQLEAFVGAIDLNSGVFFRSMPGQFWMGYESQIHNAFVAGDRTHPKDCGTGGIYRRQNARRIVADDLAWFSKTIIADGNHLAVWVNGQQVSDFVDARPAHENPRKGRRTDAGTIQLQGHDATTKLRFRNLRIVELPQRGEK